MSNFHRLLFFFTFVCACSSQAEMGVPVQLRLKSPSGTYPTGSGYTFTLLVLSPSSHCILREENFLSQTITNGNISLTLGAGTPGANDPALSLNQVYDNSKPKIGLSCVDANNNIISTGQVYTPAITDHRTIRVLTTIGSDNILVNFSMRATPYAIQAESVGGKLASDVVVNDPATQMNQTNLNDLLFDLTRFNNLKNFAISGAADSATNFTGALAGDVSGSQSATSVNKIRGVTVSASAPASGDVLRYNGTQYTPVAMSGGTVTAVTASSPLNSSGGATPNITLTMATAITNGALSSADWNTFNNKQASGVAITALSGDVTGSGPGTSITTIANNAITTNKLNNLAVTNAKINDVAWNKITGTPTTLAGYGITDAASTTLTNGKIRIGNGSNVATEQNIGGDATMDNTGSLALANTAVTSGTYGSASAVPSFTVDAKGRLTAASSSAYQDATAVGKGIVQIGTGLNVASGIISVNYGTTGTTATAGNDSRLSDARTPTGAASGDLSGTYPNPSIAAGAVVDADVNLAAAINATKIGGGVVDNTEFSYLDGATSSVQTQLNAKIPLAGGTMTGTLITRAPAAAAGSASLKLPSGTVMTTPEAGAMEGSGSFLYYTDSSTVRRAVTLQTVITKTVTQNVNNSTVLVNDNAFTFTAAANTRYHVKIIIKCSNANTAMSNKWTFTLPSGTMEMSGMNKGALNNPAASWISGGSGTLATPAMNLAASANNQIFTIEGLISVGATGGAVTLRWAQNAAVAANLSFQAGSYMIYGPL